MDDLIPEAIAGAVTPTRPEARGGIFSGEPIAERTDELLSEFGSGQREWRQVDQRAT